MIEKAVEHFLKTAGGCTPIDVLELKAEMEILRKISNPAVEVEKTIGD
jgi:hypothetical protein